MKKLIVALTLLLTFGAFNTSAQTLKIAYIDYLEVIDSLPSKLKADKEIEAFVNEERDKLLQMQDQYEQDYMAFQNGQDTLSDIIKERKMKQLFEQEQIIQLKAQSLEQDLQILNERYYSPIEVRLEKAIKIVAERYKVTYILEVNSLLYYNPETALDLTDEVKKEMMRLEAEDGH